MKGNNSVNNGYSISYVLSARLKRILIRISKTTQLFEKLITSLIKGVLGVLSQQGLQLCKEPIQGFEITCITQYHLKTTEKINQSSERVVGTSICQ